MIVSKQHECIDHTKQILSHLENNDYTEQDMDRCRNILLSLENKLWVLINRK